MVLAIEQEDSHTLLTIFHEKKHLGADINTQADVQGYGGYHWSAWMHVCVGDTALHIAIKVTQQRHIVPLSYCTIYIVIRLIYIIQCQSVCATNLIRLTHLVYGLSCLRWASWWPCIFFCCWGPIHTSSSTGGTDDDILYLLTSSHTHAFPLSHTLSPTYSLTY